MPVKKHFITRGLQEMLISEYLDSQLENSGFAGIEMQKTPLGTRITIKTAKPGIVIGKRGNRVKDLTDEIKNRFNINVPTIDVETIKNPELNAKIQAEKLSFAIEKGQNYRRATYSIMRRIIKSGARGVEIAISGKVSSQRARSQVFRAGIISKCGTPALEGVSSGVAHCPLKSGILGIRIKIMPESYRLPDEVIVYEESNVKKKPKKEELEQLIATVDEEIPIEEDEIEELEETEEKLFDDTTGATPAVIKSDKETMETEKIIDDLAAKENIEIKSPEITEKAPEEAVQGEEAKKSKRASKKSSGAKKSSRKKSSKKAESEEATSDKPADVPSEEKTDH